MLMKQIYCILRRKEKKIPYLAYTYKLWTKCSYNMTLTWKAFEIGPYQES